MNYYNEFDSKAAQWLKNLVAAGMLPPGVVDSRPIQEVTPDDLRGFTQCHFFAGIGGWSEALRIAGWSPNRPVWTGSCPCQPFSVAGRGGGADDPRHLWPEFRRLVADCDPPVVVGEQVASKDGRGWLTGVRSDLEAMGYGVGAADLCAAGVGSPHIRQRLFWVADCTGGEQRGPRQSGESVGRWELPARGHGASSGVADCDCQGGSGRGVQRPAESLDTFLGAAQQRFEGCGTDSRLEQPPRIGREQRRPEPDGRCIDAGCSHGNERLGDCQRQRSQIGQQHFIQRGTLRNERQAAQSHGMGVWSTYHIIPCGDGKARRIEPGLMPLVDGLPHRVASIRGYGNAIVPQVAAQFITAYMECTI